MFVSKAKNGGMKKKGGIFSMKCCSYKECHGVGDADYHSNALFAVSMQGYHSASMLERDKSPL